MPHSAPVLTQEFIAGKLEILAAHAERTIRGITREPQLARQAAEELQSVIYESAAKSADRFALWAQKVAWAGADDIRMKYLMTIAERRALDWTNKYRAERSRMVDASSFTGVDGPGEADDLLEQAMTLRQRAGRKAVSDSPEGAVIAGAERRQLERALRVLGDRERQAVELSQGCEDGQQASEAMGVTAGNFRVILHRAHAALRTVICALDDPEKARRLADDLPPGARAVLTLAMEHDFDPTQVATALNTDRAEALRRIGRMLTGLQRAWNGGFIGRSDDDE